MRTLTFMFALLLSSGCESENDAATADAASDATPADDATLPGADCREATRQCANGFRCIEANGRWQCALTDDAGPPPGDGGPPGDDGVPDASPLDGALADIGGDSDADLADDARAPDLGAADASDDRDAEEAFDADEAPDAGPGLDADDAIDAAPDAGDEADGPGPDRCAAEVCNGQDDDCDGEVDEDAPCEGGACREGECVELALPGAACADNADCLSDDCLLADDVPDGFCYQQCRDSGDCAGGLCLEVEDGARFCWEACDADAGCRDGWACLALDEDLAFCAVDCNDVPCGAGEVCDEDSGLCTPGEIQIALTVEQAIILPGQVDGQKWDGFGDVPRDVFREIGEALTEDDAFAAVVGVLGRAAIAQLEKPDCYGTLNLLINGPANAANDIELPIRQDTFTPIWSAGWNGVPFGPDDEIRVRMTLFDSDFLDDDDVGVVTISHEDIQAALDAGDTHPVRVNLQAPQILFVSISAIEIRE